MNERMNEYMTWSSAIPTSILALFCCTAALFVGLENNKNMI